MSVERAHGRRTHQLMDSEHTTKGCCDSVRRPLLSSLLSLPFQSSVDILELQLHNCECGGMIYISLHLGVSTVQCSTVQYSTVQYSTVL
jgi:hypothetical protein